MKTLLISLAALTLLSCDATKRHQRLIRKHPHLLETISTPKIDTVRIEYTREIECPDGTVLTVNCDTGVIYETETIQLPPTNAQIRQQERTKRNFEDNIRKMYKDSLKHAEQMFNDSLDHAVKMYKLQNKRLSDENKTLREISGDAVKVAKNESKGKKKGSGLFIAVLSLIGVFILALIGWRLVKSL